MLLSVRCYHEVWDVLFRVGRRCYHADGEVLFWWVRGIVLVGERYCSGG